MNRALVTFAVGDHEQLLELALPAMEAYADRHGYDLLVQPPEELTRPASWHKLPVILKALEDWDDVLWLDADVMIVNHEWDVGGQLPRGAWQGLVRHHTPDGEVPNLGVWYLRQPMRQTLKAMWRAEWLVAHPWWEQAALMTLLGYSLLPAQLESPTRLYRHTHWLGLEWNSHEQNDRHPDPRFAHATCGPIEWRTSVMRRYQKGAVAWASTS